MGSQIVEENTFVPKAGTSTIPFATTMSAGVTHPMAMCRTSRMRHSVAECWAVAQDGSAQHKILPIKRIFNSSTGAHIGVYHALPIAYVIGLSRNCWGLPLLEQ